MYNIYLLTGLRLGFGISLGFLSADDWLIKQNKSASKTVIIDSAFIKSYKIELEK